MQAAWEMAEIMDRATVQARRYAEMRDQLVRVIGTPDGKGEYIIRKDDAAAMNALTDRTRELLDVECDIGVRPLITLQELADALQPEPDKDGKGKQPTPKRVSLGVLAAIRPLIKPPEAKE
jgi:hypothetical protein